MGTSEEMDFVSCASSVGAQDRSDWESAAETAITLYRQKKEKEDAVQSNTKVDRKIRMPQLAHMVTEIGSETYLKDKRGDRILQLLPAQIDMKEVDDITYALAIAFYIDKKLSRNSLEKIVVSIDVRAGSGWANPPAKKIIPFIKTVVGILERNFPERLSRCILYPLPRAATVLWKMVKIFLDPFTAEKIVVIGGGAGIHDTTPSEKFEGILD